MKIFIDPGHGGEDRHNVGPNGYVEADGVLDISLRLRRHLKKLGFKVEMSRMEDKTVKLRDRSLLSNSWGADLFLSIHTNAFHSPDIGGLEIFYPYKDLEAMEYADLILNNLAKATKFKNRGSKVRLVQNKSSNIYNKDYYSVIRETKAKALLLELGFHTNYNEVALLSTPCFREKLSESIALSLFEIFHKDIFRDMFKVESVKNLYDKELINDKDYWIERLEEPMPVWGCMTILSRMTEKYGKGGG